MYNELIDALRNCGVGGNGCMDCPYNGLPDCDTRLYGDAAEAIEKLVEERKQQRDEVNDAVKKT